MKEPPFHQFVVFSVLDDNTAMVIPSLVQCNNCYAIHRILEVGVSETLPKETSLALPNIDDIRVGLPDRLSDLLQRHGCELHTWQEVEYILNKELWGTPVILSKERIKDTVTGKYVLILGKTLFRVDSYTREDHPI